MKFLLPILVALAFVSCDNPTPPANTTNDQPNLQNYFDTLDARGQFNGVVLVAKDDHVIFEKAYGLADFDPPTDLTINHQFRLASVSKQFTAMAIMILKQDGLLEYDQDVKDFIPEFPYEGITVRHLLTHTSGLPDYMDLMADYWEPELDEDDPAKMVPNNEMLIAALTTIAPPVEFEPGEQWAYSNTAYCVLATIVERTGRNAFDVFLKQRIFDPLGMESTSVYRYVIGKDPNMPLRTYGMNKTADGEYEENDYNFLNGFYGDGGIYSTTKDLYSWHMGLLENKLIPREMLEEAFTPGKLNDGSDEGYGFGWGIEMEDSVKIVHHSGGWVGYATYLWRKVDSNECFIILTNDGGPYLWDIIGQMRGMMDGEELELPLKRVFPEIVRVATMNGGDAAVARFDEIKANESDKYNIDEMELNAAGYTLMQDSLFTEALAVFQKNTVEYPESSNVFDSLGDIHLALADTAQAIASFQKAYDLDTTMAHSKAKLDELLNVSLKIH